MEYALILALISTLVAGALTQVGGSAQAVFGTVVGRASFQVPNPSCIGRCTANELEKDQPFA